MICKVIDEVFEYLFYKNKLAQEVYFKKEVVQILQCTVEICLKEVSEMLRNFVMTVKIRKYPTHCTRLAGKPFVRYTSVTFSS